MKILISLSYYSPNISGLTVYAKNLAQELANRGHEVMVLTSKHEKQLLPKETINRVKILRIPVSLFIGKGPIMFSLPFYALGQIIKADVVNCHLPQFESIIFAILAKILNKRLVLTYQTDLSWDGNILIKISKIFLLLSHFISAILADRIVALSKDYAEHSWFLARFKNKLVYIYPPVNLQKTNKRNLKIFTEHTGLNSNYLIGVVARMSSEKGIEYLLEAIPELVNKLGNNFLVVIAGPLKPIGEKYYLARINKLYNKYYKYIKILGTLSEGDLICFYKAINVLVLPSINSTEALGIVQIEAMLSGVPVVASNLPGVRIPVKITGMGELAKPKNSSNLAKKILKVLSFREKYTSKITNARKAFSINKTIKEYECLIGK